MSTGDAKDGELIGKLLGGRYRVTATIGRGGMGVVARAVDTLLNREVAVKVLRAYTDASAPELADLRARMRREAQAAARIRHRGVVTVHDVTEEEGLPVIVMELVDGPSLDDVLVERGALDPREAAAIGAELMDALDAAHRAGVLHRDVKPGNVLLERGGRVVLTDFGIATMETAGDDAMAKLTRSGEIVGSLDYLPPERAQGTEPGPASDIWSLGMTLYAAVEGTSPFRRTSVWSTLSAIVSEPLPEPQRAGPLAPVLQALMAKDPERRPTAGQARAMLEGIAAGAGMPNPAPTLRTPTEPSVVAPAAAPPGFGPPPPAGTGGGAPFPPPSPHVGAPPPPAPARRGRALVAAAAAAVVLVGGGITYALVGEHGDGRAQAAAPGPVASSSGQPGPGGDADGTRVVPSPSGSQGTPSASVPPAATASAAPRVSAPSSAKPSPLPTGCGGWNHRDPNPGTYGYLSGDYHLGSGPYMNCSSGSVVKAGTKLWYHCYVTNAYGNKWTYVRIAGTSTAGWMSNDNLTRQNGPSTHC
ncbi:serine/threonine-protein kinase [Streptomyces sp. NPDC001407]|uniref:serine/threonine-protein kinase n=1 Tax=Streptomyces sp. NPDC001407 TaxID=3364573 RepID=UPI00369C9DBE